MVWHHNTGFESRSFQTWNYFEQVIEDCLFHISCTIEYWLYFYINISASVVSRSVYMKLN
jgi:hypothetical protein